MSAPDTIKRLVELFEQNRSAYLSGKYKEAQLRQDFLNPFFVALGWDVYNEHHYAESYRDVIIETSVEIEGAAKAPDYAFRIGNKTVFFVEAKKPSVSIEYDIHPAFQVRRYAWSAKLPLAILTDFEEFAVYDCRTKPDKSDSAATGRVMLLSYADYIEKWELIAEIFAKEAVMKGKLDTYIEGARGKRGTLAVDDAFLQEIEQWRDLLARNIAIRNPDLTVPELNFAVQMTIDRIIFLRICEDRQIEPEDQLKQACEQPEAYAALCNLFKQADARYNSGLFHFVKEKDQSSQPDDLSLKLSIDDKVLKEIVSTLYYPNPYVFSEIPTAILGSVYERFLGKVIRLTAGHQAKVEEKPEVRKAGGVYYTPTYIVEYIVKNTVGKLLEGKTLKEAEKLKIVDPACGSGSFLLGAYQCLLDYHIQWYSEHDPEKWAKGNSPTIYPTQGGGWNLTTPVKKKILLNNIHGVDIDPQAVEVTKLSLSLKVLEGESQETIGRQLSLLKERALPDLGKNIQCGNSLIEPDYNEGKLFADEEERRRVNPFDWKQAFPQVFAQGGFDAVIGNPPYVRMEEFKDLKSYYRKKYNCHDERSDIYAYFIERAHKILNDNGRFGMIVSNKFLRSNYGKPLREFLKHNTYIYKIIDFAGLPVFKAATIRTIILLTSNNEIGNSLIYGPPFSLEVFNKIERSITSIDDAIPLTTFKILRSDLNNNSWGFTKTNESKILRKIISSSNSLINYCDGKICMGVKSGLTEAFVIDSKTRNTIVSTNPAANSIIKPFLNGRDIRRYSIHQNDLFLIYTFHGIKISDYPAIEKYLEPYKDALNKRATSQAWYELQQPQFAYKEYFESPKIIYPDISIAPRFALDENKYYGSNTIYFIPKYDLFLLGLLNSKLGYFYFRTVCAGLEGKKEIYLRFFGQYMEGFPIINNPANESKKNVISFVQNIIELNKKSPRTPQEKEILKREIDATDKLIDKLVYELYGLTEEEVKIVEGETL